MLPGLPVLLRVAGQPVIVVGTGEAAEAKRRLIERAGARVVGPDAAARFAIVASDDDALVAALKARGVLVNRVDRPEDCDFTLPAIVDRAPVVVAVATGGASAGLAAALRQRIEAMLPDRLGALADALATARGAIRARFPDGDTRRRALGAALAPGGALDPLAGADADAVARWVASTDEAPPARTVHLLLASPDPDQLTLAAARALAAADRVHHGADVPDAILDRARADATRIPGPPPDVGAAGLTLFVEIAR